MKKTVIAPGQTRLALGEGKTESSLRAEEARREAASGLQAQWALLDASYTRRAWNPADEVHLDESVRLHPDDFAACVAEYRRRSLDMQHGASAIGTALRGRAKALGVALAPTFLAALSALNQRRHAAREQGRALAGASLAGFSPAGVVEAAGESVETEWITSSAAGSLLGGMSGWQFGRSALRLGVERVKLEGGGYRYKRASVLAARERMAGPDEAASRPVAEPAASTAADPGATAVSSAAPLPAQDPTRPSAVERLAGMVRSGGLSLDDALQLLEAARAPTI